MARDQSPSETPTTHTDPEVRRTDPEVNRTDPEVRRTDPEVNRTDPDVRRSDDVDAVRDTDTDTATQRPVATDTAPTTQRPVDSAYVIKRQKAQFGGMKIGSCFFGWLTAAGTAVILTAAIAAVLGAVGMELGPGSLDPNTAGIASGIALLAIVFVAYLAGGYVAGRMARFNGIKQGIGVWLWAIVIAVVAIILGVVAGQRLDLTNQAIGLPQLPTDASALTTQGIITVIAVLVVSLVGAILGGLAGMRYHRRIDRRTDLAQD